jgi:hypothetical protein
LQKSKLAIIDAGHFIWEDAADTYAALITSWSAGGCAKSRPGFRPVTGAKASNVSHAGAV